jgi:hypothetical protein
MKSIFWSEDLGRVVKETKTKNVESVNKSMELSKAEINGIQRVMKSNNRQSVSVATTWL